MISNNLTWTKHIEDVVSRVRNMMGWVLRTFTTRKRDPMITMWNTQIRPILDYCSPLWSPCPTDFKNIDLLEQTLRTFTREIDGMEGLDYAERLKKLGMYSVQRRHERYKLIYMYKIKEGIVPNISETFGLTFSQRGRRGCICEMPTYRLYHNRAITARNNSFALTASSLWNALPKNIRNISGLSVDSFKRRLDNLIKLYPDSPRCASIGIYQDRNLRTTNSLTYIATHREVRRMVESEIFEEGGLPRWPGSI